MKYPFFTGTAAATLLLTLGATAARADEIPEKYRKAVDKEIISAGRKLAAVPPVRVSERAEWQYHVEQGLDFLRRHDISAADARKAGRQESE